MKILGDLNKQGTSIIMVTHSPDYAKYAHRTVNLFDGMISNEKVNGNWKYTELINRQGGWLVT